MGTVDTPLQRRRHVFLALLVFSLTAFTVPAWFDHRSRPLTRLPYNADELVAKCAALYEKPRVPPNFAHRTESDRYVPGTEPVLIHNVTIWTGENNGRQVVRGDVLLARGLVKWVGGSVLELAKSEFGQALVIVDAKGKWVTPG